MFRCQKCRKLSKPKEKSFLLVVERREHIFPFRKDANRFREGSIPKCGQLVFRPSKDKVTNDRGGRGLQIVREIRVCGRCNQLLSDAKEIDRVFRGF